MDQEGTPVNWNVTFDHIITIVSEQQILFFSSIWHTLNWMMQRIQVYLVHYSIAEIKSMRRNKHKIILIQNKLLRFNFIKTNLSKSRQQIQIKTKIRNFEKGHNLLYPSNGTTCLLLVLVHQSNHLSNETNFAQYWHRLVWESGSLCWMTKIPSHEHAT